MSKLPLLKLIDIGANLVDFMYSGIYHGSKKHDPDLQQVLERSWNVGLSKIIITGTSLEESQKALNLAKENDKLFCCVGCHPTNCNELEESTTSEEYMAGMLSLIKNNPNKVVAIGEFGLDYDRLNFCPKETQLRWFEEQLLRLAPTGLPLFLHCRNAASDLLEILTKHKHVWEANGGVVHSFDGRKEEVDAFIRLGLHIGINGCSLRTEENLETVKLIPTERLLLETDAPWCDVRPSHAGAQFIRAKLPSPAVKKEKWNQDAMVKGRNEPCTIIHVLDIVAGVRDDDVLRLGEHIYNNTCKLFFPSAQDAV